MLLAKDVGVEDRDTEDARPEVLRGTAVGVIEREVLVGVVGRFVADDDEEERPKEDLPVLLGVVGLCGVLALADDAVNLLAVDAAVGV